MEIFVHHFGRNPEPWPHLYGKVTKICVSTKHGTNKKEKSRVYRSHNHQGANSERPRAIFETPFKPQTIRNCRSYHYHRRGPGDCKHSAYKHHLTVPCCRPTIRHRFGCQERLPKLWKWRQGLFLPRSDHTLHWLAFSLFFHVSTRAQTTTGAFLYRSHIAQYSWSFRMARAKETSKNVVMINRSLLRRSARRNRRSATKFGCHASTNGHHRIA